MWVAFGIVKDEIGWGKKSESGYDILYSEGQEYEDESWDKKSVKEFKTLSKAIDYVFEFHSESKEWIRERVKATFPKHYAKELDKCKKAAILRAIEREGDLPCGAGMTDEQFAKIVPLLRKDMAAKNKNERK